MNFRSVNKFNVIANTVSGNFLPLNGEKEKFNIGVAIYAIFTVLVQVMCLSSWIFGTIKYEPPFVAFKESAPSWIAAVHQAVNSVNLNLRRGDLRVLIRKMNDILIDSDDLRRHIYDNVEPNKNYLKMYLVVGVGSVFLWAVTPIMKVLKQDQFTYSDLTLTAYLPGEPFTSSTFSFGVLVQTMGMTYLTIKKISIDTYVCYFVTLLTAEYKYVREQFAVVLRREDGGEENEKSVIVDLKKCVRHHCAVIEIGHAFIEIVGVNVGIMYLSSILNFCSESFSVILFNGDYLSQLVHFVYGVGIFIQAFLFCLCAQQLLDASTSVTDDAFHENWHKSSSSIKNIFFTIELSNRIECRLSAYRTVDLVIPTLALMLNKAYSVFLLLQELK